MIVMFADLAGYTALTDVHGDEEALAVVDAFQTVVSAAAGRHRLLVVKGIGDAFLLIGPDATAAMATARGVVQQMGTIDRAPAVRVGIHEGPVTERDGDVFGHAVNIAARVASEARAGQILVTRQVLAAGDPPNGIEAVSTGTRELRNVSSPVELFDIGHDHTRQLSLDPLCQMLIAPEAAAAMLEHNGDSLYFCSTDCLGRFVDSQIEP